METLRFCFDANPQHRDVVDHIREKYSFDERPQKGIVIQGASASPQSLSSDNYIGSLYSYLMLAKVDDYRGTALEWVREDDTAIRANGNVFPSEPGVYYVQVEEVELAGEVNEFQFYVDPLLTIRQEPIIQFQTGTEQNAILTHAPVLENSVRLYEYPNQPLFTGTAITLTADESLELGGSGTHVALGLPTGQIPVTVTGSNTQPFTVTSGTDDVLSFELNGTAVSVTFTAGTGILADDLALEIEAAIIAAGVDGLTYSVGVSSGAVSIDADVSLSFDADLTSTANPLLGFTEGFVPVSVTGLMVEPTVPSSATFKAVVDGVDREIALLEGNQAVTEIANQILTGFSTTSLGVSTGDAGDYSFDPQTGEITWLRTFVPGTQVLADYRYPVATRGPYPIGVGEVANNEAIPGAVLAFGKELEDQDVMAVVVEGTRSEVADAYGGKFNVSLDIDIIARDSMTRSEMADLIVMYLWQWRRERLAEEGIIIEDASFGGESEEPYDETGDDYYYMGNVSLTLLTDWEILIARPLYIIRVTPYSFDQDAQVAAAQDGILLDSPDGFEFSDAATIYRVDPLGGFEKLR